MASRPTARNGDEYDTTSLRENGTGRRIHRDYAAHFFRWGWCTRHVSHEHDVLEIGCGVDYPMSRLVQIAPGTVPKSYVGVDLNHLPNPPQLKWATFRGEFNFVERYRELGTFDRIVCLEVIEHMKLEHGCVLLEGIKACLRSGGQAYLSTPVFNGKAAKNHIHEYTVEELAEEIVLSGLRVVRRFGTFASYSDIKRVAKPEELATLDAIGEFYSHDVTACFLAPLYPDASRNNLWILEHA